MSRRGHRDSIPTNWTPRPKRSGAKVTPCYGCGSRTALHPDDCPAFAPAVLSNGHEPDCDFRRAETSPAAIECEHGHDVCPICDPCTCGKGKQHSEREAKAE